MDLLRTFIAIDIPPAIQKSIQVQINDLRKIIGHSPIRWVPVQNIHLTIKFLGDVSPSDVDTLTQIIYAEASSRPSFDIDISGLGSFPSSKRARVILIKTQAPAELEALQVGIESACRRVGFKPESRRFNPHLTIGRVRRGISSSDQMKIHKTLNEVKIDSLGIARVDSIHLYQSELKPTGAVYTKLSSAPLQKEVKSERTRIGSQNH